MDVQMESETFITVYLDNSIVSVKRTAAIPERVMLMALPAFLAG